MTAVQASQAMAPATRPMPRPSLPRRAWKYLGWNFAVVLEVVVILAIWEYLVVGLGIWRRVFAPPPSDIAAALVRLTEVGVLQANFLFSVQSFAIGYMLAAIVGILIGLAMGTSKTASTLLSTIVWPLYATPRLVLAPVIVMWLGFGLESKIAIVFLMAVFPIIINVMVGAQSVDPVLLRTAAVFGGGRLDVYRKIVLPFTVPYTITGLRIGITRALIGVVIAEFVGSAQGLGYLIQRMTAEFDMAAALGILAILLVVANLAMQLLGLLQRRVAPWYQPSGL